MVESKLTIQELDMKVGSISTFICCLTIQVELKETSDLIVTVQVFDYVSVCLRVRSIFIL
jgi:hypothetical protein